MSILNRITAVIRGRAAVPTFNPAPGENDMATLSRISHSSQSVLGTVHWYNTAAEAGKLNKVAFPLVDVTPGLAGEILRRNPDNRSLRATKVQQYAADMRNGRWDWNGEPIIIADTGELNDGQHRLTAIVEANLTMPMAFVFGASRASRLTVDQGAARGAADYLGMEGITNAVIRASIARNLLAWERSEGTTLSDARFVTNGDIMARVHADAAIGGSAHFAAGNVSHTRKFAAPSIIGLCHYLCTDVNPLDAATYMAQVCRGEGLRAKDPAYTVRDRLLSLGKKGMNDKTHIILRGWNAYRQGRSLSIAKIVGNLPALV